MLSLELSPSSFLSYPPAARRALLRCYCSPLTLTLTLSLSRPTTPPRLSRLRRCPYSHGRDGSVVAAEENGPVRPCDGDAAVPTNALRRALRLRHSALGWSFLVV